MCTSTVFLWSCCFHPIGFAALAVLRLVVILATKAAGRQWFRFQLPDHCTV